MFPSLLALLGPNPLLAVSSAALILGGLALVAMALLGLDLPVLDEEGEE